MMPVKWILIVIVCLGLMALGFYLIGLIIANLIKLLDKLNGE